jgi:uncharacterized damage-inducible protein DinB
MRNHVFAFALLAAAAGASPAAAQHDHHKGGAMSAIKPLWTRISSLYVKSAELMPEADFAFKPTDKVRTYGQLLGHIANEHFIFCSAVLGEKNPDATDFEKVTSRADMVAALKRSNAYCDKAYAVTEAVSMEPVTLYGETGNKLWALTYNLTHDSEHYGNIVTYLRLKGLTPPSSQGGQ